LNGLSEFSKALGGCSLNSHFYFYHYRLIWSTSDKIWAETHQKVRQLLWARLNEHLISAGFVFSGDFLKFLMVGFMT
jgi:hypothetical protein